MRKLLCFALLCTSAVAAITNVQVQTTPTQAILSFTAPDNVACSIAVAEPISFASGGINDVNAALYPGSNLDSRAGNITNGRSRVFVIGKRAAELALDGLFHSRALQAFTQHSWTLSCAAGGTDTLSGTFRTSNIPLGLTTPEVYPVDPLHPGNYAWPNMNQSLGAGEPIIDPLTGALLRRMTGAGALQTDVYTALANLGAFDDSGSANPWTVPAAGTPISVGATAVYTANGTTQPKMYVPANLTSATNLEPTTDSSDFINYVNIAVTGASSVGATGDDTHAYVCLTIDGVICAPGSSNQQEITFTSTSSTQTVPATPHNYLSDWFGWAVPPFNTMDVAKRSTTATYTSATGALTWTGSHYFDRRLAAGSRIWLSSTPYKLASYIDSEHITLASGLGTLGTAWTGQTFGVLIWKKTSTAATAITVSNVTFSFNTNGNFTFWNAGYNRQCNSLPAVVNGESGHYCQQYAGSQFVWIGSTTGTVLHLGSLGVPYKAPDGNGNGFNGATLSAAFDPARAASVYGLVQDSEGKQAVVRCDYTGNNVDLPALTGASAFGSSSCVNLTPWNTNAPHYDLKTLLHSFDSRYSTGSGVYDYITGVQSGYLTGYSYGGQDTPPAWAWVLDPTITPGPSTNPVIALMDFINPGSPYPTPARWAVIHGADQANYPWYKVTFNNYYGANFQTHLSAAISSTSATDVYVTAEPGGGGYDIARVGDIFKIDSEYFQILTIPAAGSHWTVTRAWGLNTGAAATHALGATVSMTVSGAGMGSIIWNYIADPHGLNASGTTVAQDPTMATGHSLWGLNNDYIRVAAEDSDPLCNATIARHMCFESRVAAYPGSGTWTSGSYTCPWCWNMPPQMFMNNGPGFASVMPGYSNSENHPSQVQETASAWEQAWFTDSRSMQYGGGGEGYGGYSSAYTKIGGTNNLYLVTNTLHPKNVPTIASCGEHPLLNVSPGPLTDATGDNWKYCTGSACYSGATSGQTYVNCPDRTLASCLNTAGTGEDPNGDPTEDICIGDGIFGMGSPLVQIDALHSDPVGARQRILTYGFQQYRRQQTDYVANGKATPEGAWATMTSSWVDGQRNEMFLAKLPPWPAGDSVNRGTFTPLQIQLGSVPAGTNNVIVQFGYNPSFYCTSRQEVCIANQATINEAIPFYWASETYSGLSCTSGCTVVVPMLAARVCYYQILYRNSSNTVIASGPVQVFAQ